MSDFFDSIGLGFLDPGILILVLFALFIVVLILVITDISGRKKLERSGNMRDFTKSLTETRRISMISMTDYRPSFRKSALSNTTRSGRWEGR